MQDIFEEYRSFVSANQNIRYSVEEIPFAHDGLHKWVGGQLAGDVLYAVPNSADAIFCYHTKTKKIEFLGELSEQECKWTGGTVYNGKLYMFPRSADSILVLDLETNQTEQISLPFQYKGQHHYGGVVTDKGMAFLCPIFNHDHILCINLNDAGCTKLKIVDEQNNSLDYRGGVFHPNGYVYLFPWSEGRVIKLNPDTKEYRFIGERITTRCFGAKVAVDGNIYGFRRSNGIMKVDVVAETCETIRTDIEADGFGTMLGINGKIYNIPGGAGSVYEYDIISDIASRLYELKNKETAKCAGGAISESGDMYIVPTDINSLLHYMPCGEHEAVPEYLKKMFYDDCY